MTDARFCSSISSEATTASVKPSHYNRRGGRLRRRKDNMTYYIDKYVTINQLPQLQKELDTRADRKQCDMILELLNRYVDAVIEWERTADRWDMGRRSELVDIMVEMFGVDDEVIIEVAQYAVKMADLIKEAEA